MPAATKSMQNYARGMIRHARDTGNDAHVIGNHARDMLATQESIPAAWKIMSAA